MASSPHGVGFGDELLIPLQPRGLRSGDFVFAGSRARAYENAMRLEILNQIGGNFAGGNSERKTAVVAQIECVATIGDQEYGVGLAFCTRGNVEDTVGTRDIEVLIAEIHDRHGGFTRFRYRRRR